MRATTETSVTYDVNDQTMIVETAPVGSEPLQLFRATPFEFNDTGLNLNTTETVGQVFMIRTGRGDKNT